MNANRLIIALSVLFPAAAFGQDGLIGVWSYQSTHLQALHRETGEPFEETREAGNPRVFIFTAGHYSFMGVSGDEPRPLRSEAGEGRMGGPRVPQEQRLAEYRPLDVETGTYTRNDDELTLQPLIDHIPDYMLGDGQGDRMIWVEVDGDTLVVTRRPEGGATIRDTYTRLE